MDTSLVDVQTGQIVATWTRETTKKSGGPGNDYLVVLPKPWAMAYGLADFTTSSRTTPDVTPALIASATELKTGLTLPVHVSGEAPGSPVTILADTKWASLTERYLISTGFRMASSAQLQHVGAKFTINMVVGVRAD